MTRRGKREGIAMNTLNRLTLAAIGLIALLVVSSAAAGPTETDGTPIDERIYRAYESNWRKYARFASKNDAGYLVLPDYDRRLENSRGLSTGQALDKLTKTWEEQQGNLVVKKSKTPPREEAEAYASRLPDLKIGSYGYLHSAEVVKIIDDHQMLVRELWLVDHAALSAQYKKDQQRMARRNNGEVNTEALQFDYAVRAAMVTQQEDRDGGFGETFRLVGYKTLGLRVGDRYRGPTGEGFQVGVVQWETPDPAESDGRSRFRKDEQRLVLSEVEDTMRQTLDEQGFKGLLAERGITVVKFVDLMRTVREAERDGDEADKRIVRSLLAPAKIEED